MLLLLLLKLLMLMLMLMLPMLPMLPMLMLMLLGKHPEKTKRSGCVKIPRPTFHSMTTPTEMKSLTNHLKKRGPVPKDPAEIASCKVEAYLTPEEIRLVQESARDADLSLSRWIRMCITNSTL